MLPIARSTLETIATVDGLIAAWIERHLSDIAATAARCLEHFARATASATVSTASAIRIAHRLASATAILATIRFVLKALLRVELLLA